MEVSRVVLEESGVMFQMRTAPGGIGDDGVELCRWKLIELFARQLLGQTPFAIVGVQRTATKLAGRRDNFATVLGQDLHGIAIDIAENEVLGAAGQDGDLVFAFPHGGRNGIDEFFRESRLHCGGHGLQLAKALWKQFENAAAANERLKAEPLIQSEDPADKLKPAV